jgi:hypothetical protein
MRRVSKEQLFSIIKEETEKVLNRRSQHDPGAIAELGDGDGIINKFANQVTKSIDDADEDEEDEQERKDRIYPGSKELDRLAHGIAEKRKKKPDCVPGNKWHSEEDGRFTSKGKAGSWAGGYERAGDSSCQAGKFKTKGDGKKLITRHKCGAKKTGKGKHPYKCSTSEPVQESEQDQDAAYLRAIIKQELQSFLDALKASKKQSQTHSSGCTYDQLLKFMNSYEAASKGQMGKEKKK